MVWTYDPQLPDRRDRIRLLIGDVEVALPQLADEELDFILNEEPNDYEAAAAACELIAARLAKRVDTALSGQSASLSDKRQAYLDLADMLRRRGGRLGAAPFGGGLSVAAKTAAAEDTSTVSPRFYRGQFDYPGTA